MLCNFQKKMLLKHDLIKSYELLESSDFWDTLYKFYSHDQAYSISIFSFDFANVCSTNLEITVSLCSFLDGIFFQRIKDAR